MKRYLYKSKDIDKIFNIFNKFKTIIRQIFNITNEIINFVKIIQHLT